MPFKLHNGSFDTIQLLLSCYILYQVYQMVCFDTAVHRRTCAPAALASSTACRATAMLAALSSPHSIWQDATTNFPFSTPVLPTAAASFGEPETLIELIPGRDWVPRGERVLLLLLLPPAAALVLALTIVFEKNADVVGLFAARESKMGLILLAAVRNIQLTMGRSVPARVFGSTAACWLPT